MSDSEGQGKQAGAIVIDLGKQKRKKVRRLRRGRGPLLDDVMEAVAELRERGDLEGTGQPVVVVVERKSRRYGKKMRIPW